MKRNNKIRIYSDVSCAALQNDYNKSFGELLRAEIIPAYKSYTVQLTFTNTTNNTYCTFTGVGGSKKDASKNAHEKAFSFFIN